MLSQVLSPMWNTPSSSLKYSHQQHSINLSDPDTLQHHLDIWFARRKLSRHTYQDGSETKAHLTRWHLLGDYHARMEVIIAKKGEEFVTKRARTVYGSTDALNWHRLGNWLGADLKSFKNFRKVLKIFEKRKRLFTFGTFSTFSLFNEQKSTKKGQKGCETFVNLLM